jgi:hypothetical protein
VRGSSYLDYVDFRARAKSFQSLAIAQQMSVGMNAATATPNSKPENVAALLVSANFFSTLEVRPIIGRGFLPEEGQTPEKYPVAIISYFLWNHMFAKEPDSRRENHQVQRSQLRDRWRCSEILHRHRPLLPPRHFRSNSDERPSNSSVCVP